MRKIDEAISILASLGFPKGQQNERSALSHYLSMKVFTVLRWHNSQHGGSVNYTLQGHCG